MSFHDPMSFHDIVPFFLGLGLGGMFAISLLEKFIPVVPSYVMLMLLGMTVPDQSSLLLVVLTTAAGSLCGSLGWFAIGRLLGERRVENAVARFGRYVFFRPATYRRLASAYRRNRFRVTMLGQTLPVARVYLGLPAGVIRLRASTFIPAAAIGILIWNVLFLTLGYLLKGSSYSPANMGVWASFVLIGAEVLILGVVHAVGRRRSALGSV